MDTLIYTDNNGYQEEKAEYLKGIELVQSVVNAFNSMTINGAPIEKLVSAELTQAIITPKDLVFDKMTGGEDVVLMGLPVNKAKALEILQFPVGYGAYIASIEQFKADLFLKTRRMDTHPGKYFIIDENDDVQLSPTLDAQLLESHRYYTRTERAEKEKAFADAVIAAAAEHGVSDLYGGSFKISTIVDRLLKQPKIYGQNALPAPTINYKLLNQYTAGKEQLEINRLNSEL